MTDDRFIDVPDVVARMDVDTSGEVPNRGLDTQSEEPISITIGLVDIDTAIMSYMNDIIQPEVLQDSTKVIVPVMYANPERWKSIRKDGILHDGRGKLQIPLIVIRRTSITKNNLNSSINNYLDKDFTSVGWDSRNRYDRFAVQNGIQKSKRYISMVYPDYFDLEYECIIWTEYQSQMNSVIEQISFEVENYWGEKDKFKFKTAVNQYVNETHLPDVSDRIVRSTFLMTVKAYLLPEKYVNKYGSPASVQKDRFTNKKLVISEKIIV